MFLRFWDLFFLICLFMGKKYTNFNYFCFELYLNIPHLLLATFKTFCYFSAYFVMTFRIFWSESYRMTRSDQMRMAKSVSDTGRLGCKGCKYKRSCNFLRAANGKACTHWIIKEGEWHKTCWTDDQEQTI